MKVSLESGKLLEVLKQAKLFVGDRSVDDRLRFIQFRAAKSFLEVEAYDSICFFKCRIEANVKEEGSAIAEFKILFALASSFDVSTKLDFGTSEKFLILKAAQEGERNRSQITIMPDWFEFPKFKAVKLIEMPGGTFKDLIKRTLVAVSLDTFQPLFQGMNFYLKGGGLTVTATNYKMIVQGRFREKRFGNQESSFTVGGRQLSSLIKIVDDDSTVKFGKVKVGKGEQVLFKVDSTVVLVRLLEEKKPETFLDLMKKAKEKIEGVEPEYFALDRGRLSTLLSALRLIEERNKLVEVRTDGDRLVLKSERDAMGVVEHSFILDRKMKKFECLINGETLQLLIDSVFHSEDEITFAFREPNLAFEITSEGNKNFLCLFPPLIKI